MPARKGHEDVKTTKKKDESALASTGGVLDGRFLAHRNNLTQKGKIADSPTRKKLVTDILASYNHYLSKIDYEALAAGSAESSVAALNEYLDKVKALEKVDKIFNWRSDFAGSVIPEFLLRGTASVLAKRGLSPLFSTKESVVELTLSSEPDVGWDIRRKNQDLVVGLVTQRIAARGKAEQFVVPVVACEVKTNTDINKLSGLTFSAERLKRTFPNAVYFLATETVDFSPKEDYASGMIDEVYVLRKQVRSQARKKLGPLCHEVFAMFFADVATLIERTGHDRGHVYSRLPSGRLLNVR
jgi:hypothetical protein